MIEVEVKARVRERELLEKRLRAHASGKPSLYLDTYYDWPDGSLSASGRELRLRVVEGGDGERRCLLTYKGPAVESETGSKPETELAVSDAGAADEMLLGVGFTRVLSFEKRCVNFAFRSEGRDMLVTVVTVPELEGTFVEVETQAARDEMSSALASVRALVTDLGIVDADLTTELYTEAVARQRAAR